MSGVSSRVWRLRVAALLLAAGAPILLSCGAWSGAKPVEPGPAASPSRPLQADRRAEDPETKPGPAAETAPEYQAAGPGTSGEGTPPVSPAGPPGPGPTGAAEEPAKSLPTPGGAPHPAESGFGAEAPPPGAAAGAPAKEPPAPPAAVGGPSPEAAAPPAETPGRDLGGAAGPGPEGGDARGRNGGAKSAEGVVGGRNVVARLPENLTFDHDGPHWARGREELVYRVEFLGITMGYARFVFNGKVLLAGREVYHLSVRAWTSNVLALIYPINDTIDYYMDIKTFQPLRQEYTSGGRKKDDVAIYDQDAGKIVYRYKESGEIRKRVDAVPNVYDPVTLAYFLRSREPGGDEKGRNVYAGRKVWEISARSLGAEKIATERGEVDTVVIQPVIKRDGKIENKGDLRMWMTRDERKIPVRVYAKFKKIRTWTLVGELMSERKGG